MTKRRFNTLCAATLLTVLTFITSCSKSKKIELKPVNLKHIEIVKDNVTYYVHPQTEALLAAYRLAGCSYFAYNTSSDDDYIIALDRIMATQKEHDFIKLIQKLTKKYKGSLNPFFEIANYISDDFTELDHNVKDMAFWNKTDSKTFITLFNDFINVSNFEKIWMIYESAIKANLFNVVDFYDKNEKMLTWLNTYFFNEEYKPTINIHVSPIMNNYFYAQPCWAFYNHGPIFYFYQPPYLTKEQSGNDITACLIFIQSLLQKCLHDNYPALSAPLEKGVTDIFKKNNQEGKPTESDIKEIASYYLAFFPLMNYVQENLEGEYAQMCLEGIKSSFISDDYLFLEEVFQHYQENRTEYPYFEEFFRTYFVNYIKKLESSN